MTAILEKLTLYWAYPFVRYALIVGVLIALCSSLLGVTLVLKRFSFIGDGLSHVAFGAMAIAAVLQITRLARRCYRELSGGQQQRVLLARALCATQKMLLLDEPVSGLDPKVTAEMYALIEKLNREDGITVIMISHDVAAAVRYASHILHIGDTVFFGTRADYLQSPQGRLFAAENGGDEQ